MATRARVELRGSLTHQGRGRAFKKGSPQILTNSADIVYYQQQAGFAVTMLSDKSKAATKVVAPEPDDDSGEGDNDFNESELRKMKKADLQEVAEELGLDIDGTVNELIERIMDAQ